MLKLTAQQWNELDALRFSTSDKVVFRNATMILMSDIDVGRTKASIADDLGFCLAYRASKLAKQ